MGITYSEDQLSVIEKRNKNMLVSAAAGSGKTTVLVERIIRKVIEDKVDIDKILVVTFTNASAADMKLKVLEALEKKLVEMPGDEHLIRQATLIHNALITTIDSFCLNLVRENFHKIGLDPDFRIAGPGEGELLMDDAMANVISEAYESRSKNFENLVDCYTKKDKDTSIEESIRKLYNYAMSYPWPEKWLAEKGNDYEYENPEALAQSELMKEYFNIVGEKLLECTEYLASAREKCCEEGGPSYFLDHIQTVEDILSCVKEKLDLGNYDEMVGFFETLSFEKAPRTKPGYDEELTEVVKSAVKTCKETVKKIKEDYFKSTLEEEYEAMELAGRNVKELARLTLRFKEEFDELKRSKGIIDFADMEHMAVEILIDDYTDMDNYRVSDVAEEYRNRYNEVMIDEYQDSNLVQEILLAAVSHQATELSPNRFMVGDIKQSIYKFRLARPQIFKSKVESFDNDPDKSITLYLKENYRSRREVVDSVNCVFENIMDGKLCDIEYSEKERLNARAGYKTDPGDNVTELVLLEKEDMNAGKVRAAESDGVSVLIEELVREKKVEDKKTGELRPADFGDIAVLLRNPSSWRTNIREAFNRHKIPFHMEGVGAFYASREIQEIVNFLKVLDNPLNDIPLYGTMVSFFGGLNDEDCARIKGEATAEEFYLYEKLKGFSKRHPDDERTSRLTGFINKFRELSTYTPINELITMLVNDTGYLLYICAEPDGRQREANVELLIKKASDYSETSFSGLFHFLRYIELLEKTERDEGEAGTINEDADTVHVMSIHKSKGLEFPIVILMGIENEFNNKDQTATFILDIDEGIGAEAIDPERRIKTSTIKRKCIAEKIAREELSEEIRVLYVAMTRAREKLILVGAVKDAENYPGTEGVLEKKSYLKLIRNAVIRDAGHSISRVLMYATAVDTAAAAHTINKAGFRTEIERGNADSELTEKIRDILDYSYPFKNLAGLYTKTTVSNIKMAAMEETQGETEELFKEREKSEYIPAFAGGGVAVSGTDRGNAYHKLMQLADFAGEMSAEAWKAHIRKCVELEMIGEEEVKLVRLDKLFSLASSSLGKRMHEAALRGELYKEQPFVMGVPATKLNPEFPEEETVLVQGVIDAFFIEDDEIVVLDYKTDKVSTGEELAERYKAQLDYYADALNKLTGKAVKEKLLYSFGLNAVIVVE